MHDTAYLARRQARIAYGALKHQIVFGLVISGMMLTIGLWRYFFVIGALDPLWMLVAWLGAAGLALTLVFPSAWQGPQDVLNRLVRVLGGALFAALLLLVYAVLVTPFGWLLRLLKGDAPIYRWRDRPIERMEGWHPKEVIFESQLGARGRTGVGRRFFKVIGFFAERGHYLLLPALIILISIGLVLFFVKSSALAPLIYTLF